MPTRINFNVETLGKCKYDSPVKKGDFTGDSDRILYEISLESFQRAKTRKSDPLTMEVAGPRREIFFDPNKTRAGFVTCGGLCPGINDVIRGAVMTLWYVYGVREIYGFRYGYQGLVPCYFHDPLRLTPQMVEDIHKEGGSVLSSSRGPQDPKVMVNTLERMGINILFTIGGDGTQRGSLALHEEAKRRGLKIAMVGVPKTIDNDLCFIEKSFGFETAFSAGADALKGAHEEAVGAPNGIVIVKLMGRQSGFIAANAAIALNDVNIVLVPEVPFKLEGEKGLLAHIEKRLRTRRHALLLVAEGAGQELMESEAKKAGKDASGNVKLIDIGRFLVDSFDTHFKKIGLEANIKYIDPSYIIRSVPANPTDSVYCLQLAQNAVHAAMAGRTGMVVGQWNNTFVNIPIAMATMKRNTIDPDGQLWRNVLESTGQPANWE